MFTTNEFWLFVVLVLVLHYKAPGRFQNIILLAASYVVYAALDWRFLALLWLSTAVNFALAKALRRTAQRRYLVIGILYNLAVLGVFKYAHFFLDTLGTVLARFGATTDPVVLNILLPLGISFYTFRLLSALLDVASKRVDPRSVGWIDFALYVAFFPQIVSGPIERLPRFLPRLQTRRHLSEQQIVDGLLYILIGFFYKVAIADAVAPTVNRVFAGLAGATPTDTLITMILLSVQIYADFAGYSLLAIGISIWFGLPAMENFRHPYFSKSIIEFWTRWHISLSLWFRDYLFYPLSRFLLRRWGNKRTFAVQVIAYFVTMLVTGFWHGANWTFVVWGILFGLYIVVERVTGRHMPTQQEPSGERGIWRNRFTILVNILLTQAAVTVSWVFFRAPSLGEAMLFFQRLQAATPPPSSVWWLQIVTPVALLLGIDLLQAQGGGVLAVFRLKLAWQAALLALIFVALLIFGGHAGAPFVYFQF